MARILIVEDESLIAMLLADWLDELGHTPVGPAGTIGEALAVIASEPVDAAIVDLHLRGAHAAAVAIALQDKRIPFAIASGDAHTARVEFGERPALSKPYAFEDVRRAIGALLGGA